MRGLLNDMSSSRKIACWFMLSIAILLKLDAIASLVFYIENGCKLHNDCFTVSELLTLINST